MNWHEETFRLLSPTLSSTIISLYGGYRIYCDLQQVDVDGRRPAKLKWIEWDYFWQDVIKFRLEQTKILNNICVQIINITPLPLMANENSKEYLKAEEAEENE